MKVQYLYLGTPWVTTQLSALAKIQDLSRPGVSKTLLRAIVQLGNTS